MVRVSIQTIGTRGDIQPVVAIAEALTARGCEVVVSPNIDQADFARACGLTVRHPLGFDFKSMMQRGEASGLLSSPLMWAFFWSRVPRQELWDLFEASRAASAEADVVIATPLVWPARLTAEVSGASFSYLSFQPGMAVTGAFPCPLVQCRNFGSALNKVSYLFRGLTLSPGQRVLKEACVRLGLPGHRAGESQLSFRGAPAHRMQMLSRALCPEPEDWGGVSRAIAPLEPKRPVDPIDPALEEFLARGSAPVYVGFGSMPPPNEKYAQRVRAAAKNLGVRLIVQKRFARDVWAEDEDAFIVDRAPYDHIFSRCAGIIHHGGANTVNTALRAGRPQAIAPIFADQAWYAWRAAEAGIATKPLPTRLKVSTSRMEEVMRSFLTDEVLIGRAAVAGRMARAEDGPKAAADLILALAASGGWAHRQSPAQLRRQAA